MIIFYDIWEWITAVLIVGAFKLVWRLFWTIWWLGVFLVLSVGAGIVLLVRRDKSDPHEVFWGHYSDDGEQWWDDKSQVWHPLGEYRESCEVSAFAKGTYWRKTALFRLVKRGMLIRYHFMALRGNGRTAMMVDFPQEARRNVTLDTVDPAMSSMPSGGFDLSHNRDWAVDGLDFMEWLLTEKQGWTRDKNAEANLDFPHWYSRVYTRRVRLDPQQAPGVEGGVSTALA